MAGRNFERASHRAHQLSRFPSVGVGTGYDRPESAAKPRRRWCKDCRVREIPEGREGIWCLECRRDREREAHWNHVDQSLPDEVLLDKLKSIAAIEGRATLHRFVAAREERRGAERLARLHRSRALLYSIERKAVIDEAAA